jgi:flavin reductase (DIM6/NTAB) family NADH-FMN oxidoreductase RutF
MHSAVLTHQYWGVSVLASHQSSLANRFAGRGPVVERGVADLAVFEEVAVIPEAILWLRVCRKLILPLGDHLLISAEVTHSRVFPGLPLTYFRREFGTLG